MWRLWSSACGVSQINLSPWALAYQLLSRPQKFGNRRMLLLWAVESWKRLKNWQAIPSWRKKWESCRAGSYQSGQPETARDEDKLEAGCAIQVLAERAPFSDSSHFGQSHIFAQTV